MDSRLNSSYWALRIGLGLAAFLAGLDKFFNLLANWEEYVSPMISGLLPVSNVVFMRAVGVIEMVAGLIVLTGLTRLGGYIVMAWLIAIALALLTTGKYFDVAVRDLVMSLGAWTLAHLSQVREEVGVRSPQLAHA